MLFSLQRKPDHRRKRVKVTPVCSVQRLANCLVSSAMLLVARNFPSKIFNILFNKCRITFWRKMSLVRLPNDFVKAWRRIFSTRRLRLSPRSTRPFARADRECQSDQDEKGGGARIAQQPGGVHAAASRPAEGGLEDCRASSITRSCELPCGSGPKLRPWAMT